MNNKTKAELTVQLFKGGKVSKKQGGDSAFKDHIVELIKRGKLTVKG